MSAERIVIVGGGIAGVATAWWLARAGAGRRVVLVEREDVLGQHSSGRNAAILRTAIPAPATRRLALETMRFLRRPPSGFCAQPLLDPVGLLIAEGELGTPLPDWAPDLMQQGEAEVLDPIRARALAPHFQPVGERLWWLPRQGVIDVAALMDAFLRGARRDGVEIRTRTPVLGLHTREGAVQGVRLQGGEVLEARWTVLAAGAWARDLGASVGALLPLRSTRRHILVTAPDTAVSPRWPVVWDDRAEFYARPESGGLLVSACDLVDVHPDRCVEDDEVRLSVAEKVGRLLPELSDAGAAHFWAGLRTLTPDDAPRIGPDATVPGLFWVAGLGGHGMGASSGVGRVAAGLLLDEHSGDDIEPALAAALAPEGADPGRRA